MAASEPRPLPAQPTRAPSLLRQQTMKYLILPALAGLALMACTSEISVDSDPGTPQEAPDETPKAKTVAFKIDGMS